MAKTTTGKPCINTCTEGYCAVDYQLKYEECVVDEIAGVPVHYTSMYNTGDTKLCMSNCDKFGYSYEWCFTKENYEWDYCSSKVRGPSNELGYDVYGNQCVSNCTISHITGYFECLLSTGTMSMCAVPAIVPVQSILKIFSNNRTKRGLDKIFAPQYYGTRVSDGSDGHTQDLKNNIYNSGINFETITNPPAPFTNVVTMNSTNTKGKTVYLPLIVEATLRQRTPPVPRHSSDIPGPARTNVKNMYNEIISGIHVGHIIAFQNGGTNDLFNFAGQTAGLNLGQYKTIENIINDWINYDKGTVQMTVVVVYSGTKPKEFAVKLKFFEKDGSLHSDVLDLILKNV